MGKGNNDLPNGGFMVLYKRIQVMGFLGNKMKQSVDIKMLRWNSTKTSTWLFELMAKEFPSKYVKKNKPVGPHLREKMVKCHIYVICCSFGYH